MDKPETYTRDLLNYHECEKYVGYLLGYDIRDTLNCLDHFENWCEKLGYDPDKNESYRVYKTHIEGGENFPEVRDWWHFLIDQVSVNNPCIINIHDGLLLHGTSWQNEITAKFIEEFGEEAEYEVSW